MSREIFIRPEKDSEHALVENLVRNAFWNIYAPGCDEHYLVHLMRAHKDFIPELDLVFEMENEIVGNIMYTKAKLVDEAGIEKSILTFGPVSILPKHQRKGYGKQLIEYSFERASALGWDSVVIFGNPSNYVSCGFKSCKKHQVSLEDGSYPTAMLVAELKEGALEGKKWVYYQSPFFDTFDPQKAQHIDAYLKPLEKKYQPSQEAFYIYSNSVIRAW